MAACLGMCGIVLDVTVQVKRRRTRTKRDIHVSSTNIRIRIYHPVHINNLINLKFLKQFNPDTDAVEVTRGRRPLFELFPPRGTPINDSYNPLRVS